MFFIGDTMDAHNELKEALIDIRSELDEHLDAINQNTSEVGSVQEVVSELDYKLDKLSERLDALQALLLSQTSTRTVKFTSKEDGVLKVLAATIEPLTSSSIGKRCGLTADLAAQTLYCLKQKGVPVLAQTIKDETYYVIDDSYRDHKQFKAFAVKREQNKRNEE